MMPNQRNLGPLLIILIVLLVAMAGYFERTEKWGEIFSKFGISQEKQLELIEKAPTGQVIDGFPTEFIEIAKDTKVVESGRYRQLGISRGEALIVRYETRAPISDMFAAYVVHFTERGFVLSDTYVQRGTTFISFKGEEWEISVEMYAKKVGMNEVEVVADMIE